uniref:Pentacotripeptide-repeat region of PRORP domain-containing protein n=1 Tax=Auxenochlorella protothecoides TaxID=3075 RepID=A0A1D2AEU1_AUXPR
MSRIARRLLREPWAPPHPTWPAWLRGGPVPALAAYLSHALHSAAPSGAASPAASPDLAGSSTAGRLGSRGAGSGPESAGPVHARAGSGPRPSSPGPAPTGVRPGTVSYSRAQPLRAVDVIRGSLRRVAQSAGSPPRANARGGARGPEQGPRRPAPTQSSTERVTYERIRALAQAGDVAGCLGLLDRPGARTCDFNAALRWLSPRKARTVLGAMQARGVPTDSNTARSMINILRGSRPELDAAMHRLVDLRDRGALPHNFVVPYFYWASVHADAGDVEGVLRVMWALQSGRHPAPMQSQYVTLLVKAYGYSGRVDEAWKLVLELEAAGQLGNEHLLRALVVCFGRNNARGYLTSLLARLEALHLAPPPALYNAAIDAFAECGDVAGAAAVLARVRADPRGPALRSVAGYTSLAKAQAARGDVTGVRATLAQAAADGVAPNVFTWNCLLHACRVAEDGPALAAARADMAAAGVAPNAVTHDTVLSAHAARGDLDAALAYAAAVHGDAECDYSLFFQTTLLRVMAGGGRVREAQRIFRDLRAGGAADDVAYMTFIDGMLDAWEGGARADEELLDQALEAFEGLAEASPRLLEPRPEVGGAWVLDLHSHSAWTAQLTALRMLRSFSARASPPTLKVITGRGRRSNFRGGGGEGRGPVKAGSSLRDAVLRCLEGLVDVHQSVQNGGVLFVLGREIERLARRGALASPDTVARWLVTPRRVEAAEEAEDPGDRLGRKEAAAQVLQGIPAP